MIILSISTSTNICSVCLGNENTIIKELSINDAKTHSENLMPLIDKLLKTTNYSLKDINYLACDVGPGSFTGIRIGIATIKAISEVHNIPIVPISSLQALSYNVNISDGLICSMIDARNENIYYCIFDKNHLPIQNLKAEHIDDALNCLSKLNNKITFVGNGAIVNKEKIIEKLLSNAIFYEQNDLLSSKVLVASRKKIIKKDCCNADELLPVYLRKSQAERMLEKNEK